MRTGRWLARWTPPDPRDEEERNKQAQPSTLRSPGANQELRKCRPEIILRHVAYYPMPSDASQQIMAAVFGVCVAVLVRLLLRKTESTQQQ